MDDESTEKLQPQRKNNPPLQEPASRQSDQPRPQQPDAQPYRPRGPYMPPDLSSTSTLPPSPTYPRRFAAGASEGQQQKHRGPYVPPTPPHTPAPLPIPSLPPLPTKRGQHGRRRKRKINPTRTALIFFAVFLVIFAGVLAFSYYYTTIHQPLTNFIRPVSRGEGEPANAVPSYNGIQGRSWNILLLGSDNDQKYRFPAVLTQVMMVVHIDPQAGSVYLVSIPRDSWVFVPQIGGMHKIDQAFLLGVNRDDKFESGVRLARTTIEQDYGIVIDRYAWVGLSGFAKVIDTLGGVDIDVTHPIVDDAYPDDTGKNANPNDPYAYKRLYIAPGPQHLNGEQALEYVRSRHADLVGDIGRTQRQQQVLQALRQKLTVASIVNNLPALIKDLTGQVYTDLSEQEMIDFANFGRTLSASSIQRITLGPGQGDQDFGHYANVYDPSAGSNQQVIIPHCNKIEPTLTRIFGSSACNVEG
ncbi:MAG: LCP family protein [Ktedonobacteraceae bacterium]|nr:LCP family protein [Ktedonobacteraceae bacterium]